MADATYGPLVYMTAGGNELVVASTGLVTVEDGGSIDIESGGGIDVQSGADITMESGGHIAWPVTGATSSAVGSTTLTTLPAEGLSIIATSGDERLLYLAAPVEGADKYIVMTDGSTAALIYIDTATVGLATVIDSVGTDSTMHLIEWDGTTNSASPAYIHLKGFSATKWVALDRYPTSSFEFASTSS